MKDRNKSSSSEELGQTEELLEVVIVGDKEFTNFQRADAAE